jgi:predicted nuclease of predicted toxin-antitoxin system
MRFLADESCDFAVVRALRAAGHDVIPVAEVSPQLEDPTVLDITVREDRILLTEDKDFGQLVYAARQATAGVVLLRFPARGHGRPSHSHVFALAKIRNLDDQAQAGRKATRRERDIYNQRWHT